MGTHQIYAENIKCMGCVNKIRENLLKMKGVVDVDVFLKDGKVSVTGIAVERKDLIDKLNILGYTEKGHNSLFSKAKSFVTCTIEKLF